MHLLWLVSYWCFNKYHECWQWKFINSQFWRLEAHMCPTGLWSRCWKVAFLSEGLRQKYIFLLFQFLEATFFSWLMVAILIFKASSGQSDFPQVIHLCMLSHFSCVWLCAALCSVAHPAPLSMGFSRQEYWSGLPCPPPGVSSWPGDQTIVFYLLHWQVGSLPLVPPGKPLLSGCISLNRMLPSFSIFKDHHNTIEPHLDNPGPLSHFDISQLANLILSATLIPKAIKHSIFLYAKHIKTHSRTLS